MTRSHHIANQTIDYNVLYKKRKTMGIYIDVYGNIELRVPVATKDDQITGFIDQKWLWIISRQKEMKEKTKGFKQPEYESGETFLYLGQSYPIIINVDEKLIHDTVIFEKDQLEIRVKVNDIKGIKKLMKRFYYKKCKALITDRIKVYQPKFKMKPRGFKISSNKKTWGTCNSMRELTFNYKLAMAPIEVIDYIVIHEMCHMVHLNHDRSFWRLVGKYMPDYEEKQEWLSASHWKMAL